MFILYRSLEPESSVSCPGKVEWGSGGIMCRGSTSLRNWVSNCSINCHLMCVQVLSLDVDGSCVGVLCVCVDVEGVDCSYVCVVC